MHHPISPNEYLDQGEGPIVVLLHSSMASKSQWRSLCADLAPAHRTIAVDLHGYGAAPMPTVPHERFGLEDEADRVERILASLRAGRERGLHLVGHSYGGAVALRLARRLGSSVLSVSLYEPTAFHVVARERAVELDAVRAVADAVREARAFGATDAAATAARFIDFWSGAKVFDTLPQARRESFARQLPKAALDFQGLFDVTMHASDYRALRAPTCLIGGVESPACTRSVIGALAAVLPCRSVRTVDAGHMGPVTHPELINPLIVDFIAAAQAANAQAAPRVAATLR